MFKYILIPAMLLMLFACNLPKSNRSLADSLHTADTNLKTISPQRLIVAGKSIGLININDNADNLVKRLGKPDSGDAAMGASLMMWITKHDKTIYKTTVYAHRNMGGADEAINYIKEIRVTSPYFKTADYAGEGSELKDVQKIYKLKKHSFPNVRKFSIYDDYNAGIGFEVDSTGRCVAILVHAKGDSTATYLNMP